MAQRQLGQGHNKASWHWASGGVDEGVNVPSDLLPLAAPAHGSLSHSNAAAEGLGLGEQMQVPERQVACQQQARKAEGAAETSVWQLPGELAAQHGLSAGSVHVNTPCPCEGEPMQLDALVRGVSRLSVAAEDAAVPQSFSFGRRRGSGRMSRGRQAAQRGT